MRQRGAGTIRYGYLILSEVGQRRPQHVLIAEKALGKPLPQGAQVHHVDEDRANNAPMNLVICPDQAYHSLLHARMRAFDECGHYDWRPCDCCRKYDDLANMRAITSKNRRSPKYRHPQCNRDHVKKYYERAAARAGGLS